MTSDLPVTRSLLETLTVEHGPTELIARFLLIAEAESRQRGISLTLGGPRELVAANAANRDNWLPLFTAFDPQHCKVTERNLICILGRDSRNNVVACHVVKRFNWKETNFAREAASLRLFYDMPEHNKLPGEECIVTSQLAEEITGLIGLSGGAWCHPDFRRRGMSRILPLAAKAVALTYWNIDAIVALMADYSVDAKLPRNTGYPEMEWGVDMIHSPMGTLRCVLLRMPQIDIIRLMSAFVSSGVTQVDIGVDERRAKQQ